MHSHIISFLIILYSLNSVSCNPNLNGFTINDGNDQIQEESSSYLQFTKIPDEDDARKILFQMANQSVHTNTDDLDLSASANMAHILTNVNDNEQRNLQQQLQTDEDPLQKILPRVKFDCKDRKEGYYSDPDFNCEVFHYCKSNGYRFTLVCPIKSRYSMKAMTCVYEDNKLYECPGVDTPSSISNASSSITDSQTTSPLQSLATETEIGIFGKSNEETTTTNSSVESNKMSSWNEVINRSHQSTNNPTQLINNNIMDSLGQITTTLSSIKLANDIVYSNANSSVSIANSTDSIAAQFGTRFQSGNLTSATVTKNSANRHDLMDAYIMENDDDSVDGPDMKRSKRRKRSVPYAQAAIHAIHYSPKYTYPFLSPYMSDQPISSLSHLTHSAYMPFFNHPLHTQPLPVINNYATPVLPNIMPLHYATTATQAAYKQPITSNFLNSDESQFRPQYINSPISLSPTTTKSTQSSLDSKASSTQSVISNSTSTTGTPSSFASLSLASAASQLAVSLANISKNHKNTKIRKHLSKLASSSSNLLPPIRNLTSSTNVPDNLSASGSNFSNNTIPKEKKTAATVWTKPSGKQTFATWSFSTIPVDSRGYALSFTEFPYFSPQFNVDSLRSFPSTFNLISDSHTTALNHPFNNQLNTLDLNSLAYRTGVTANNNYPISQIPKLHIEYRPAVASLSNTATATKTSGLNTGIAGYNEPRDIDEIYGKRKVSSNEFRDLLNAYKQTTTNPHPTDKILYGITFKSIYAANDAKEGQFINQQDLKQYSPEYGFPKSALESKRNENLKESVVDASKGVKQTNYHQTSKSKYQSQSSNDRFVKHQTKFYTRYNDAPKYRDKPNGLSTDPRNKLKKKVPNYDDDAEDDLENKGGESSMKSNHLINSRGPTNHERTTHQRSNKSMNRKTQEKRPDYLDNYHETADDEDFFRSNHKKSNRVSGRQLSYRNSNRDSKTNYDPDFADDFFNDESDRDRPQTVTNFRSNDSNKPTVIRHSQDKPSRKLIIPKSSRKLIGHSQHETKPAQDDDSIDDLKNDGDEKHTNYDRTYDRHHEETDDTSGNYLNKNQLNFRETSSDSSTPRSVLVKTSSFSFEIPNHSVNEEVEFDSDHYGKQPKRPSYTLDQQKAHKSISSIISTGYRQANSSPTLSDYEKRTANRLLRSRSNVERLIPTQRTEKQKHSFSAIKYIGNRKHPDGDDISNQFDLRRQPNPSNHYLPHSHVEDVMAYNKAIEKPNAKGKFKQFFHRQELKHTASTVNKLPQSDTVPNSDDGSKNEEEIKTFRTSPSKNDSKNKRAKIVTSNEKFIGSPVSKPPRIAFNWHSSIDHSSKQPKTTNKKIVDSDANQSGYNDDINDQNNFIKSELNMMKHQHSKPKNSFYENKHILNQQVTRPPPHFPAMTEYEENQPSNGKVTSSDDWFKQDWLFKDIKELNDFKEINQSPPISSQKSVQPNTEKKLIKNEEYNNLGNNEIDPDDIEYEDDKPPATNDQSAPNRSNGKKDNLIDAKTKLQVMDQKNKQYTPMTTTRSPDRESSTFKPPASTTYKTKFLSSSKFVAERQKLKNSFQKPSASPPLVTTSTTTSSTTTLMSRKTDDLKKAKVISLQFKKDNNLSPPKTVFKPLSTRTTKQQQDKDEKNEKSDNQQSHKKQSDNQPSDKQSTISRVISKSSDQSGKKVIVNSSLQNSSTTINAQIIEKMPISVDSIFDTIDEENSNLDYESNIDSNKKTLQDKQDDLMDENDENSNESNENSLDNLTTNLNPGAYGSRITNNGKLQPKVSIKASYSSISSTIPRAMARTIDIQKLDTIGFRSLDKSDSNIKTENDGLIKNRMKQFRKQNWLSPLTTKPTAMNTSTTTITINAETQSDLKIESNKWKGFNAKQQKVIEQKKNLDDKSITSKSTSPYLSKFRKEFKEQKSKDSQEPNTTTLKSTATTVPTTTSKSIDSRITEKFKTCNRFKITNGTSNQPMTTTTILLPLGQSTKTNYNLNFNSNHSIGNTITVTQFAQNIINQTITTTEQTTTKPYKRIFSAFSGGAIQHKSRN